MEGGTVGGETRGLGRRELWGREENGRGAIGWSWIEIDREQRSNSEGGRMDYRGRGSNCIGVRETEVGRREVKGRVGDG